MTIDMGYPTRSFVRRSGPGIRAALGRRHGAGSPTPGPGQAWVSITQERSVRIIA
ncbi:MAG: hypothetical protein AAF211_33600 [Myxococcota bacterium]